MLHRALTGYVEDRTRRPAGAMTAAEVRAVFAERGIEGPAAVGVVETLEACERATYGGGAGDVPLVAGRAVDWLRALEQDRLA